LHKGKSATPVQAPPSVLPKRSLLLVQKKGQPSKATTRIKRRKISQERVYIEVESEEEDQPPLKRVQQRMKIGPPTGKSSTKATSAAKPKSVGIVSPLKTPTNRRPRTWTVEWPKIDKP